MSIRRLVCIGRIHLKKQNQFAFCYDNNEQGYTFLNLILSFFIYSIIISSLTIILHFLLSHSQHPNDLKPYEWELFVIQLHKEFKEANNVVVNKTEVTLLNKQGQLISINHYQNLIRRQVVGKGHEIFLLNVKSVTFQQEPSGVRISVVSEAGKNYSYTFRSFKDKTNT
ncbi:MAG: competence type IV pilus minor pilin ComGF [Bacillota bacterium]